MNDPNVAGEQWYSLPDAGSLPNQGDQFWGFVMPTAFFDHNGITRSRMLELDIIVLTQGCDLEHAKVDTVLTAPFHSVARWIEENPEDLARLEDIREGYDVSLYILPCWPAAGFEMAHEDRIVDFGELRSVERGLIDLACSSNLPRLRLRSPAREHFAQAVARSFMRIGLPEDIPSFRLERTGREESALPATSANATLLMFGIQLDRDLPTSLHKRRRTSVGQDFVLLSTRGYEPAVVGAGCTLGQAERSLALQLGRRWQWLQSGDQRFAWLSQFLGLPTKLRE